MTRVLELHAVSANWFADESIHGYSRASSVSLQVDHGEWIFIAGANGVGKSTLVSAIAGTANFIFGEIVVDGVSLTLEEPKDRFSTGVSLVPQSQQLEGPLTTSDCTALVSLNRPALDNQIALADLYDSCRGRGLMTSSGTFQDPRLFDLVVALASSPSVLLMDEIRPAFPSSRSDLGVYEWIKGLIPWTSVLFTEHDIDLGLAAADRVLWLTKGQDDPVIFDPDQELGLVCNLRRTLGRGDLEEQLMSSAKGTPAWRGIIDLGKPIRDQVELALRAYLSRATGIQLQYETIREELMLEFRFLDSGGPAEQLSGGQRIVLSWLLLEFTGLGQLPEYVADHLDATNRRKISRLKGGF